MNRSVRPDRPALRRDRLLRRLKSVGADALLVTSQVNVRYLTGFTGEDSFLIVGRGLTVLVSDSRFETQIAEECPGLDSHIRPRTKTIAEAVGEVLARSKVKKLAFRAPRPRTLNGRGSHRLSSRSNCSLSPIWSKRYD